MNRVDLLIVGAGPAGMAAATEASRHGLAVMVIDDQAAPGGQIWRSIETAQRRDQILGHAYTDGRAIAERFRASGALYEPGNQLWHIEPGFRAFISRNRISRIVEADAILLATGAQERPVPFPGWTLPGVLTVGAAQILLKNAGQVPAGPVWIAGSGPLPLLYAVQLLKAGGQIAGILDTTPPGQWRKAVPFLPAALRASADLLKGLGWTAALRWHGVKIVRHVEDIEAVGEGRLQALNYRTADDRASSVLASVVLVHEGVVPNIHTATSLGCQTRWNSAQDCFEPILDSWGESSVANLYVAGDGASIAGAKAALLRGALAATKIAERSGRMSSQSADDAARPIRRKLARELAIRPFLDALFKPRAKVFAPADRTIVCRCEEVSAGTLRSLAATGRPGPNQMKAASRAGMGACQGRQCGYTVTRILAAVQDRSPSDVGYFHIRPPLKPVTLGELALLDPPRKAEEMRSACGTREE